MPAKLRTYGLDRKMLGKLGIYNLGPQNKSAKHSSSKTNAELALVDWFHGKKEIVLDPEINQKTISTLRRNKALAIRRIKVSLYKTHKELKKTERHFTAERIFEKLINELETNNKVPVQVLQILLEEGKRQTLKKARVA